MPMTYHKTHGDACGGGKMRQTVETQRVLAVVRTRREGRLDYKHSAATFKAARCLRVPYGRSETVSRCH
jgi:hypothetical protein